MCVFLLQKAFNCQLFMECYTISVTVYVIKLLLCVLLFICCHCLQIIHSTVVDTALVFPHRKGLPYKRALKTLMAEYMQRFIQDSVGKQATFSVHVHVCTHYHCQCLYTCIASLLYRQIMYVCWYVYSCDYILYSAVYRVLG